MNAAVVLNVGPAAYFDIMNVAADNGIEPYGAVVAHLYISCNNCSLAEIAVLPEAWSRHACQFLDNCHFCKFWDKGTFFYLEKAIFAIQTDDKVTVDEKIRAVRLWMRENGVGALIVPTDDPHGSEYLAGHWQCRRWLTGFTGSAGDAVVTDDETLLWTDSRYWLQAEEQLAGTEFSLMRIGQDQGIEDWLEEHGYVNTDANPNFVVRSFDEPFDRIWADRPPLPLTKAWIIPDELTGESAVSKLSRLVSWLVEQDMESVLISDLAEVAWMLNIRGGDIEYNPFVIAFLQVNAKSSHVLYVNESQVVGIREYLSSVGVDVAPYEQAPSHSVDVSTTPVAVWKAAKNTVEQEGFCKAHVRDGVAMVRFLSWLDGVSHVTETDVDRKLTALRAEQPGFMGLSFETIAGYGAHGAIVHYEATPETDAEIRKEGLLLLDSGAHYCFREQNGRDGFAGTTDVTRTIAMGEPSDEERRVYTLVLKGHLQLQHAVFPAGTTGLQLDTLARAAMWRAGYDYGHGTGHGVGHVLGVHEGPVQIRKNHRADTVVPVCEGNVITDEPGVYVDGKFGVRIENTMLCVKDRDTDFGSFLRFEPLTLCPYDRRLIEPDMLTDEEVCWIDVYHRRVREVLLPLLNDDSEREWLLRATESCKK